MNSILLASAMICTMNRMPDNSCQQCCETETVSACKFISKCPLSEEEKRIEQQRKIDAQYLELQIQRERTKQIRMQTREQE